ncbi:MAG: hypothetical protein WAT79_08435 [Saprospiraceae bacterium]
MTLTIHEIKAERDKRISAILTKYGVFFAFSIDQFNDNKTPKDEGEKYLNMGMGAYIPKSKFDAYLADMEDNDKWFKDQVKANDQRRAHIAYELSNHECYYTGDIDSAVTALGDDYTQEEVYKVYIEERQNVDY